MHFLFTTTFSDIKLDKSLCKCHMLHNLIDFFFFFFGQCEPQTTVGGLSKKLRILLNFLGKCRDVGIESV